MHDPTLSKRQWSRQGFKNGVSGRYAAESLRGSSGALPFPIGFGLAQGALRSQPNEAVRWEPKPNPRPHRLAR